MSILVQKFGGSSLSSIEKLKAVAQKVAYTKQQGNDVVVVVSAMGNTTNDLLKRAHEITSTPSRRELDMLLSVGERISMALLSMAIHEFGYEATSLTGSQCGIITTDSHSNARIIDVRPFRVQDELAKGKIVIVAGYQGTSYRREVTTLGRGGSDTTAVALAAALGAECQIYSDVDGIYTADPRVVVDAKKLHEISYDEMLELASSGAKVLNDQAVAFAKRAQIALYARSTHVPESKGTIVRPDGFDEEVRRAEERRPEVIAVSQMKEGVRVSGEMEVLAQEVGDLPMAAAFVAEGDRGSVYLPTTDIHELDLFVTRLQEKGLVVDRELSAVSMVGDGVGSELRWTMLAQKRLAEAGVECRGVSVGLSRVTFLVDRSVYGEAVRALHEEFVTTGEEPEV